MSETDETVADVLEEIERKGQPVPLLCHLRGDRPADMMDYEDWVRPMKLTGGRVCLRVKGPGWNIPNFYRWQPDGLELRDKYSLLAKGPEACRMLRADLDDLPSHVTPVLREDTPFGEDA